MNLLSTNLLRQKAKKIKRKIIAMNLKSAKSALIVYDATDPIKRKEIINFARFLKEEGLTTDTIAYYKKKNKEDELPQDELGYVFFDKKSCNFLGFPIDNKLKKKMVREYHMMIDLNLHHNFTLEVISSLSKANFKVGKSGSYRDEVCDLTISTESNDLSKLIEQIKNYLQMINRK